VADRHDPEEPLPLGRGSAGRRNKPAEESSAGSDRRPRAAAPAGGRPLFVLRVTLAAGLAAVVAFLALRTSPYLQYVPWMPRRIGVWADSNGILRNVAAFLALGLVVFPLLGRGAWQVAALVAFAAGVEVAQHWIPGRVFDWRDIVASVAGVLLAWAVAWVLGRTLSRPR
jgi:VanZ family protein